MNFRAIAPLAALASALLFSSARLDAQPFFPLEPDDGIAFDQVGFDFGGGFAYPFSAWGHFHVDPSVFCERAPLKRGYINVETDRGWVIQNLTVDCQERLISDDPITAYFELRDPNDHTSPVEQLPAKVFFAGIPPNIMSAPQIPQINFQLPHTTTFSSGGCTETPVRALGDPPPPASGTTTGPTESHILPNPVNVESAKGQCFPMSVANSLQYLEDRYGLPVPNDHKQGFQGDNSLVGVLDQGSGRPAQNRRMGSGTPFRAMMKSKLEYLDDNDLEDGMVMRHQGRGYGSQPLEDGDFTIGTVFTVTSKDDGPKVSWKWICDQIKAGEDIEISYTWEDAAGAIKGGHAVRVYGCGQTNGRPWVRYLHDRDQDNDSVGLETVKVYMEDLDGDGTPNFGARHREVLFAWSESVTDEVKTGQFAPPQTTTESIVNAASFLDKKLTGGAIGTVFGIFKGAISGNLSEETRVSQALPTELNGVRVWVNGVAAPLFFAGEGQVNFLVPSELEPGIASLIVTVNGVPSDLVAFPIVESAPGMFVLDPVIAGPGRAVAQNHDFTVNLPDNPAVPGKHVVLYLTGTGPTTPPIPTGELAPSAPLATLDLDTTITIGGADAPVLFAGAAPGFTGLTQINATVPQLAPGDHAVVVTVGGVESSSLVIAVGP